MHLRPITTNQGMMGKCMFSDCLWVLWNISQNFQAIRNAIFTVWGIRLCHRLESRWSVKDGTTTALRIVLAGQYKRLKIQTIFHSIHTEFSRNVHTDVYLRCYITVPFYTYKSGEHVSVPIGVWNRRYVKSQNFLIRLKNAAATILQTAPMGQCHFTRNMSKTYFKQIDDTCSIQACFHNLPNIPAWSMAWMTW